ncbi:hypothetical protein SASPL_150865 [Salvia splendens]|uniref:Uncharacterized protein n=1 Tax=Salvia splendens TaxID=180675 RepID=A0A8X8Z248_SALSN|nr:hypothetical protein SASPL_150865 [Salvia splendens]
MSEAQAYAPSRSQNRRSSFRRCDRPRRSWSDREEVVLISCLKDPERMEVGQWLSRWIRAQDRGMITLFCHAFTCAYVHSFLFLRQDTNALTMRHKAWPYWDDWKIIFGKDRATSGTSEGMPLDQGNKAKLIKLVQKAKKAKNRSNPPTQMMFWMTTAPQSGGQNVAVNTHAHVPKKMKGKCKTSDDDSRLLNLFGNLHVDTNARLDKLTARIGYEMDLRQARKEIFRHLGDIPELTENQCYDLCDIIGKENSRLEILKGLPDASKPGYVRRLMEKEPLT